MFRRYCLPWIVWVLYRLWTWTWRIHCEEPLTLQEARARGEPLVFAHWHGGELCIVPLVTEYKIATMTSTSKDGQLIDFTIRRLGGATSRGSSTRGGIGALKGLVRLLSQGYNASMAVDGPKGPLHKVKPGVFELSRLGNAKIVPVGTACSSPITFQKSWNKAQLPKPFSKVVVYFAEPWPALQKSDDIKSELLPQRLAEQISKACQQATDLLR
jgi:lysophospholipid acyltransferase (LPLAT)-like uncharacterized protein